MGCHRVACAKACAQGQACLLGVAPLPECVPSATSVDCRLKYRPWMSMAPLAIEFLYSRCCRVVPIDPDGSCDALDITFFMLTCQERQQLQVLR